MQTNKWLAIAALNLVLVAGLVDKPALADETTQTEGAENYKNWVLEAELLRDQGDLLSAQQKLDFALQVVEKNNVPILDYAAVELASGYNLSLLNNREVAEQRLKSAYQKIKADSYLHALADQYLAGLYLSSGENEQAVFHINSGLSVLKADEHSDLRLSLQLLQLETANQSQQQQAEALLALARQATNLNAATVRPTLMLKLVQKSLDLNLKELPAAQVIELQRSNYDLLTRLLAANGNQNSTRIRADATGKLAQLYQQQHRHDEALLLTERAITMAHASKDKVLAAQLAAQLGELFRLKSDDKRALDAYTQAVADLYSIRTDMPITLPDGRSVLVAMVEPIYRNYVDLLLQTPMVGQDAEANHQALIKAIDSMEAIKEADMQDFFLGRCSVSSANNTDWKYQTFADAAIVYPILLKDRIELVVKTEQKLVRHTVKVNLNDLQTKALAFGETLHAGKDYRALSKQFYEWLVLPIQQDLQDAKTNVLVYVPDRSLRAIPFSALSDGKAYVVEQYAVVTLPSLQMQNLVRSRQQKQVPRTLLAGLSKPDGAAIDQLPQDLVEKISGKQIERQALIDELSLPSVEQEISTVANKDTSTTLLNNQFTVSALKSDIETGDYDKIHIASHGYFGKNAKDSFIMAYDKNLTLLDFKNSLETDNLKREPIELLTLSACKTAEGDDRMLLGFSGLAVKSNVLSAVGSLWSINDEATMEFMKLFYQGLGQSLNKAQAMREAQVSMIKTKKFRHPFFWSPFILIGNWQ